MKPLLLTILIASPLFGQVAAGNHTFCQASGSCTTPAIDTRNASVIVVYVAETTPGGVPPADSQGNTWTAMTQQVNNHTGQMFCASNPLTSANHTFTNQTYGSLVVQAFSSTSRVTCPNAQDGNDAGGQPSQANIHGAPNGLTITVPNSLWVSGIWFEEPTTAATVDTGGTISEFHAQSASPFMFGIALAWGVGSGPINPFWTMTTGGTRVTVTTAVFNLVSTSITASPTNVVAGTTTALTLTGLGGTAWSNASTVFTVSGPTGTAKVSQNVTSATAATLTVTAGTPSGTLTIFETVTGSAAVSIPILPACTITDTSLPNGLVGGSYTHIIGVNACPSASFAISTGTLPAGLSLDGPTGTISGTPTTLGTSNFTVAVTSSNGNPAKALSIAVTPPVLTSVTAAANSPNSILVSWNTATIQDSQVKCGSAPGGPYPIATPVVDTVKTGDNYYGRTAHSVAIIVPTTNTSPTAYYCVPVSTDTAGVSNIGAEVHSGTLAALVSVPFTVGYYANPIYYNDQANGNNGFVANGRWYDSDTAWGAWADDGYYFVGNDTGGVSWAHTNNVSIVKLSADTMNITQLGNTTGTNSTGTIGETNKPTTYTADNTRPYTESVIAVRGVMVQLLQRTNCTAMIKTTDHWATTISPARNTGPGVAGVAFTGPGNGVWDYPTAPANCSGGQQQYWYARHCQDWGGVNKQFPCTHNAGTDGWVYFISSVGDYFWIGRTRVEDIPITENALWINKQQWYTGSGMGNDGLQDSKWGAYGSASYFLALGGGMYKPQIHFIPAPFNRWVLMTWASPIQQPDQGGSILIYDLGLYPWAINDAVKVASIPKDVALYPRYYPVFPNFLMPTYTDKGNGTASVRLSTTGSYMEIGNTADNDRYSPTYRDLILIPRSAAPSRQLYGNNRGQHISTVPDLLYTFDGMSLDTTVRNRVHDYYHSTSVQFVSYGQWGMNQFGYPGGSGYSSQQGNVVATNYNVALNDFTVFLTFMHDPFGVIPANETPFDKVDLQVFRNGSTANSWQVKVGGITSPPFTLNTDGNFVTLMIRRVGSAVTVYSNSTLNPSGRLTALASFTSAGALGANVLTLGALAGGSQYFFGTLGELGIFSVGLSDADMIREMAAVRADMAARVPAVLMP